MRRIVFLLVWACLLLCLSDARVPEEEADLNDLWSHDQEVYRGKREYS